MRKVIFWDFHGTLTYDHHLWTNSVLEALGSLAGQYKVTYEGLRPFLKDGFPWDKNGKPELKGEAWWDDRLECFIKAYSTFGIPEKEGKAAARRARSIILSPKSYKVRPDASAVLALSIYKGYKNYLLSNNYPEMEQVLEGLFLRRFFTGCVVSGAVGANKPEEKIFRIAEKAANFPKLVWMVGDSPVADMRGAKRAGWKTAFLSKDKCDDADISAPSLTELIRML